jgi:hypothetical protein
MDEKTISQSRFAMRNVHEMGLYLKVRHARACPGHPRLSGLINGLSEKDVDGRDKPGHDENFSGV